MSKNIPQFSKLRALREDLKDNKHISLHLGRKYARIFVLGHYLFLEAHSFPSLQAGSLVWVGYHGQRWQRTEKRQSRREKWGEEKWACTQAIDFWILPLARCQVSISEDGQISWLARWVNFQLSTSGITTKQIISLPHDEIHYSTAKERWKL